MLPEHKLDWNQLDVAASSEFVPPDLSRRFVAMSACSLWASYYLEKLSKLVKIVGVFDEKLQPCDEVNGLPSLSLREMIALKRSQNGIAILDFSRIPFENYFNSFFCNKIGLDIVDFGVVLKCFDVPMMYESPGESFSKTQKILDSYKLLMNDFDDQISKQTLMATLLFRLTFDRRALFPIVATPDAEYFNLFEDSDGLPIGAAEYFADVGAYRGDTVYKFLAASRFNFSRIDAFEPDKLNYAKLREAKLLDPEKIFLHRTAVANFDGVLSFDHSGTAGSRLIDSGAETVQVVRLDSILERLTLLKIDVEGFEDKVITGTSNLINKNNVRIATACYHYSDDLLKIISSIRESGARYSFKLRHYSSYCGDTCLYAVPV